MIFLKSDAVSSSGSTSSSFWRIAPTLLKRCWTAFRRPNRPSMAGGAFEALSKGGFESQR